MCSWLRLLVLWCSNDVLDLLGALLLEGVLCVTCRSTLGEAIAVLQEVRAECSWELLLVEAVSNGVQECLALVFLLQVVNCINCSFLLVEGCIDCIVSVTLFKVFKSAKLAQGILDNSDSLLLQVACHGFALVFCKIVKENLVDEKGLVWTLWLLVVATLSVTTLLLGEATLVATLLGEATLVVAVAIVAVTIAVWLAWSSSWSATLLAAAVAVAVVWSFTLLWLLLRHDELKLAFAGLLKRFFCEG